MVFGRLGVVNKLRVCVRQMSGKCNTRETLGPVLLTVYHLDIHSTHLHTRSKLNNLLETP
jgi:hypothetical protein